MLLGPPDKMINPPQIPNCRPRHGLLPQRHLSRAVAANLFAQPPQLAEESPERADLARGRRRLVPLRRRDLHRRHLTHLVRLGHRDPERLVLVVSGT